MQESKLKHLCRQLANIHKSTVVAIVLPKEPLLPKHLLVIQELIGGKECRKMDIVLHSSGGDINAAYQIIEILRNHCGDMTLVVPIYAKSAASLFILGSNKIIMGELAELGPLDTQVVEREKGGRKYTSALNPFKTLEELQRFSLETFDVTVKLLLRRADLSIEEAIKHGMDFAARISTPLFAQLNTEKVGEYSRALAVGKEYGERLLRRYTKWQDVEEREKILEKLVRSYPSHDYIIDYKELKEIGFNASLPSEDEKPIVQAIVKYVLGALKTEIICVEKHLNNVSKVKSAKKGDKHAQV